MNTAEYTLPTPEEIVQIERHAHQMRAEAFAGFAVALKNRIAALFAPRGRSAHI